MVSGEGREIAVTYNSMRGIGWMSDFEEVLDEGKFFKDIPGFVRELRVPSLNPEPNVINPMYEHIGPSVMPVGTYAFHLSHDPRDAERYVVFYFAPIHSAVANGLTRGSMLPRGAMVCLGAISTGKGSREIANAKMFLSWRGDRWVALCRNGAAFAGGGYGDKFAWIRGCEFADRYDWRVRFRGRSRRWLTVGTTPEISRQVFRLRDIPDGKRRRAALLNWVNDYSRRSRVAEEPHTVSGHLRGSEQFTIDGIDCHIDPPAYLREKLEASR
jgi:hypothetical protein